MSNLFVEPEHGAHHSDVSKTDPLSHKEGTGVQVLVQHSKDPLHVLLCLLCGLDRSRQKDDYAGYIIFKVSYIGQCQACCTLANWPKCNTTMATKYSLKSLAWPENAELYTCLLNCMIPRVGKTHALAGGMISESAKLTHCSTWAAA